MELELRTLWAGNICYVIGVSLVIGGVVLRMRKECTVLTLISVGCLLNTAVLLIRWERMEQGLLVTMFEILSSNTWSLVLIFAITYWRIPSIRPFAALAPISSVLMRWSPAPSGFQDALSRYWAFITWLLLAAALHVRVTFRILSRLSSAIVSAVFVGPIASGNVLNRFWVLPFRPLESSGVFRVVADV